MGVQRHWNIEQSQPGFTSDRSWKYHLGGSTSMGRYWNSLCLLTFIPHQKRIWISLVGIRSPPPTLWKPPFPVLLTCAPLIFFIYLATHIKEHGEFKKRIKNKPPFYHLNSNQVNNSQSKEKLSPLENKLPKKILATSCPCVPWSTASPILQIHKMFDQSIKQVQIFLLWAISLPELVGIFSKQSHSCYPDLILR